MKEQEGEGWGERAGAINEVVKLNLAVFARAASVHLSLSLSLPRSIVSRPISLADRNQLSLSPFFPRYRTT